MNLLIRGFVIDLALEIQILRLHCKKRFPAITEFQYCEASTRRVAKEDCEKIIAQVVFAFIIVKRSFTALQAYVATQWLYWFLRWMMLEVIFLFSLGAR